MCNLCDEFEQTKQQKRMTTDRDIKKAQKSTEKVQKGAMRLMVQIPMTVKLGKTKMNQMLRGDS